MQGEEKYEKDVARAAQRDFDRVSSCKRQGPSNGVVKEGSKPFDVSARPDWLVCLSKDSFVETVDRVIDKSDCIYDEILEMHIMHPHK